MRARFGNMADMKFHCLCMSPAIDATVVLPRAPRGAGEIFKDVSVVENVGGKGLNVARWLALRGAEVSCGGLLGEGNDAPFRAELAQYGIHDCFRRVPGNTRRNEVITWPGGSYKLNQATFPHLSADACADAEGLCGIGELTSDDVVVLSGSLPKNCAADFYARVIAACRKRGIRTVLDTSGAALVAGFSAGPDVIKPNAEECAVLTGFVPVTSEEFRLATARLKEKVAYPIISDGARGCWFDGTFVQASSVAVVDTTSAGDTLLAEWCWSGDPVRAVKAGSLTCAMPGSRPPDPHAL